MKTLIRCRCCSSRNEKAANYSDFGRPRSGSRPLHLNITFNMSGKLWVKLVVNKEEREIRVNIGENGCVYDLLEAIVLSNSDLKVRDLICFAKQKAGNGEEEVIGVRQNIDDLEEDSIKVEIKALNVTNLTAKPSANCPEIRKSRCPQNDIEKLIEAGRAAGLDIKIVENDPNDPIHDTSCRGGLGKFNCERTAFNMHHALQFFHAHADELGLKYVSTEYSEEHPLDIAVVWQDLKLPDIAQSLNNIQECNASYIYYICLRLFDLFFMFGIYICPHYYISI